MCIIYINRYSPSHNQSRIFNTKMRRGAAIFIMLYNTKLQIVALTVHEN